MPLGRKSRLLYNIIDALFRLIDPVDIGYKSQRFLYIQILVKRITFRQISDVAFYIQRLRFYIKTAYRRPTRCLRDKSCEYLHGGGFTRAIWPQETQHTR